MRKHTLVILAGLLMSLLAVSPALAYPGKTGTTCTPCHTDGRSNPTKTETQKTTTANASKSAATKKSAASKTVAKKTAVSQKAVKKISLPAGIISKGAFASQLAQTAPANAETAITWQEAARMAVIAAGLEKEAQGLTASQANHLLADYVDQHKVAEAYRPYMAIAVKKGLYDGALVKGQKYLYPASMAQEIYAKQVVDRVKKLAAAKVEWPSAVSTNQVKTTKMNHAILTGPFPDGPSVTKTCLLCHDQAAEHVLKSGHWKWAGATGHIQDRESLGGQGKKNALNNFCVSIAGNEPRCTSCHIGYGWKDNTFDFTDKTKIDCLICHADLKTSKYKKNPAGFGNPAKDVDLVKAAQSVGKPKRDNCGACHYYAGGGDDKNSVKQPGLNSTLSSPDLTRDHDVHMGGKNMACQACHRTLNHKIAGAAINLTQREDGMRVDCGSCHNNGQPHKNETLNKHADTVACQTCHIPTFSKSKPAKMRWDWSTAGMDVTKMTYTMVDGNPTWTKQKGSVVWEKNVVPKYAWYNGKVKRYLLGDPNSKFMENGVIYLDKPMGDINDKQAKIYPFKIHTGKQPSDAEYKYLLTPATFGNATDGKANGYWGHWDWNKALADGAKASGIKYSGKYEFVETAMYLGVDHEVVPADKALKCTDCHNNPKGRLDWKALGYKGDPWVFGSRK